jgi:hypothetical protein
LGFRRIADTAPAPPVTPSPVPSTPAAKMRSRAALYRAERSAKVPAPVGAEAGELGLELSLASPFF